MTEQLTYIITSVVIVVMTILIGFLVNRFFIRLIRKSTDEMKNDPTSYQFLRRAVVVLIYLVGFSLAIYIMPNLRALASSLLAGAGILAVALGFASQHALSNVISGFFIVMFKPFRINDRLDVGTMSGIVEDITLRHVVIRDFENRRIIIPNSVISNENIVNSNLRDDRVCKWIDLAISYSSNIELARKIMKEEILNHPFIIDPRTPEQLENGEELVPVRVTGLGDFSVNMRAWAWAENPPNGFLMKCQLLESIKMRFDNEGIEIPFPYQNTVFKNPIKIESDQNET